MGILSNRFYLKTLLLTLQLTFITSVCRSEYLECLNDAGEAFDKINYLVAADAKYGKVEILNQCIGAPVSLLEKVEITQICPKNKKRILQSFQTCHLQKQTFRLKGATLNLKTLEYSGETGECQTSKVTQLTIQPCL